MLYVERTPSALLRPWVRMLWYCCAPEIGHARERVLPNGCLQILLNLRAESLTDCGTDGFGAGRTAGALVMGARSRFEVIATEDLAEIAGAVIEPGGFGRMFRMRADLLEGGSAALADVWGGMGRRIVERMCEAQSVAAKPEVMEAMLQSRIDESLRRSALVDASLREVRRPSVTVRALCASGGCERAAAAGGVSRGGGARAKDVAAGAAIEGSSEGAAPRNGGAVGGSGAGLRVLRPVALCESVSRVSGVDPTTYCAGRGCWQNHLAVT